MKPPQVPPCHRAHRSLFSRWLGSTILKMGRWQICGEIPGDRKLILAVGPHTSNWDFVFGMAALLALDVRIHWLGKHTLFRPPYDRFMHWLGGLAVDRSQPAGIAEDIGRQVRAAEAMIVAITPEGTRSRVEHLKTGFLRIARATPCAVLPVTLDYSRREIGILPLLWPGDSVEADVEVVHRIFAAATPKRPENFY